MKKDKLVIQGKKLRQDGFSLREISEALAISKSTASLWLREVEMTGSGKMRFDDLIKRANRKGVKILAAKKSRYLQDLDRGCSVLQKKKKYSRDDLKIFLALLYWGEGAKTGKRLAFINSDPGMVRTYLKLLRSSFTIREDKIIAWLHLHDYHDRPGMIDFWSKITGIDSDRINIYSKKNTGVRKKVDYKGCISINYHDYRIFDEVMLIIKRFNKMF